MIRRILISVLFLTALMAAMLNVGGHILAARAAQEVLGVPVKIAKLDLGIFSGRMGLYGVEIRNPEGFKEKTLASIPEIYVSANLLALFKRDIHIREIRLNLDQIIIEKNAASKINLLELKTSRGAGGQASPQDSSGKPLPPSEPKPAPKMNLKIDEVRLSLGRARYVDSSSGTPSVKEFPLEIRDLVLRDVTDPAEVVQEIVAKTLEKAGMNALLGKLSDLTGSLAGEGEKVLESVKGEFGGLVKKLKASSF